MTELVLAALVVVLVGWHMWAEKRHATERKRLTDAVIARHSGELVALDPAPARKIPKRQPKDQAEPQIRQWGA